MVAAMSGPSDHEAVRCTAARPLRVIPMIEEAENSGDARSRHHWHPSTGTKLMGSGTRVYRAEDPRPGCCARPRNGSTRRGTESPPHWSRRPSPNWGPAP